MILQRVKRALETNREHINQRIQSLETELAALRKSRADLQGDLDGIKELEDLRGRPVPDAGGPRT